MLYNNNNKEEISENEMLNISLKDCKYLETFLIPDISMNEIKNKFPNYSDINIDNNKYYDSRIVLRSYYDKEEKCIAMPVIMLYNTGSDVYDLNVYKTRLSNKVLFDAITDSLHDLLNNEETKKDILLSLIDVIAEASKIIKENDNDSIRE